MADKQKISYTFEAPKQLPRHAKSYTLVSTIAGVEHEAEYKADEAPKEIVATEGDTVSCCFHTLGSFHPSLDFVAGKEPTSPSTQPGVPKIASKRTIGPAGPTPAAPAGPAVKGMFQGKSYLDKT